MNVQVSAFLSPSYFYVEEHFPLSVQRWNALEMFAYLCNNKPNSIHFAC